jgi:hypothetical protein
MYATEPNSFQTVKYLTEETRQPYAQDLCTFLPILRVYRFQLPIQFSMLLLIKGVTVTYLYPFVLGKHNMNKSFHACHFVYIPWPSID